MPAQEKHLIQGDVMVNPSPRKTLICSILFLFIGFSNGIAQERSKVPSEKEALESSRLAREIFGEEYEKARSRDDKSNLAQKILEAADEEADSVPKYVLLRLSRNVAINAGDVDLALDIQEAINEAFEVNPIAQRVETLTKLCEKSHVSQVERLLQEAGKVCERAVQDDQYDSITELLAALVKLASRSKESELKDTAKQLQQEMALVAGVFNEVRPFLQKMKDNPNDPGANLVVGKYYCFVKSDWKRGLPHLAKCGVAGLESIAKAELKSRETADSRMQLADQWWDLSQTQVEEDDKVLMMLRAGFHYKFAAGKLKGLKKAKAQKRADEAARYGELEIAGKEKSSSQKGGRAAEVKGLGPVQLSQRVVEYELPSAFDDVVVGGSGRYLVFHLATASKLAFFDVMERKITEYVSLESNNMRYTAGAENFYIAYREKNTLERWSLKSFKRELTVKVPFENPIDMVIMGAGAVGPVFIGAKHSPGVLIHPRSMTPLSYRVLDHRYKNSDAKLYGAGPETRMRASFNGQTFTNWATDVSPSGFRVMVVAGKIIHTFYEHDTSGYLMPSPDGELIHSGKGIFTMQIKPFSGNDKMFSKSFSVPAVHGNYSVRVIRDDDRKVNAKTESSVTVHVSGGSQPLLTLNKIRIRPGNYGDFFAREKVAIDKRIFMIPASNLLITLPSSNQSVVMHQVNLDEELDAAGIDYLFVVSRPPSSVSAGRQYRYQVESRSKNGGLRYSLDSGPKGMKISSKGLLTWRANRSDAGKEHTVILTVHDSKDQKATHTFKIAVE